MMQMLQLNPILTEVRMKLTVRKVQELLLNTKVKEEEKEIKEIGDKLAKTNSIKDVIGLTSIILWEELILKLGDKEVLMDILIERKEVQVMVKELKELKMIQFGLEMIGQEAMLGMIPCGKDTDMITMITMIIMIIMTITMMKNVKMKIKVLLMKLEQQTESNCCIY